MYKHVLVGVEDAPAGLYVVESAAMLAMAHSAQVTLVHAFSSRPFVAPVGAVGLPQELDWVLTPGACAERLVESAARRVRAVACGVHVEAVAVCGPVASVLLQEQERLDADVIVLGDVDAGRARSRRGITRAVARLAPCDLVVVNTGARPRQRISAA